MQSVLHFSCDAVSVDAAEIPRRKNQTVDGGGSRKQERGVPNYRARSAKFLGLRPLLVQ